ncbi:hypothetical protein INT45_006283 [Circinella minor]|uniref:Uncharacterized protein n=1 Tax=Circinella minor TaxID=1195481 RepID=A0A8H7S075_9FUNG|nr:hypothetical protein INT45_006283 [Circinella minor]
MNSGSNSSNNSITSGQFQCKKCKRIIDGSITARSLHRKLYHQAKMVVGKSGTSDSREYLIVRDDDGIGYVVCGNHCSKRIRVDRFHYHYKQYTTTAGDGDMTNSAPIATGSTNVTNEEGIIVDNTSKLVFCHNRYNNIDYQFMEAWSVYEHIITKHQSLAHLLTGWNTSHVADMLHSMGVKEGDEAAMYFEKIGKDALPRISVGELPQDGMINVRLEEMFYQCKVQRLSAGSPYFKVLTDNSEVQQINQELNHRNPVLQQGLQRYIQQHRNILAHYSSQQLGSQAEVHERRAISRFHEIMHWESIVKKLLHAEDTMDARGKLSEWASVTDETDEWSLCVHQVVKYYMQIIDKSTRGPDYYLERRMVMSAKFEEIPTHRLTALMPQSQDLYEKHYSRFLIMVIRASISDGVFGGCAAQLMSENQFKYIKALMELLAEADYPKEQENITYEILQAMQQVNESLLMTNEVGQLGIWPARVYMIVSNLRSTGAWESLNRTTSDIAKMQYFMHMTALVKMLRLRDVDLSRTE